MRSPNRQESRRVSVPGLLFLAAGIYLVVRVAIVAQAVLNPVVGTRALGASVQASPTEEAVKRDAGLAAEGQPKRDPFRPVPASPGRPGPRADTVPPETIPLLNLILVDKVNPEVTVTVDGVQSGRLRVGQTFQGWTVTSISSDKVVVTKGEEAHTLTLTRSKS